MDEEHRSIAEFYNNEYYENCGSARPTTHLRRLGEKLKIQPGQKVLDIACGKGDWLKVCHDRGAEVFGIDIATKAISSCIKTMPDGDFRCQPAENLPYGDRTFDVITCLGSLEHFLDQERAVREMARVAKPDAKILILVPNSGFLTYRMGFYSGTQQQAARETIRSLGEWQKMIERSNLVVESRWKDLHVLSRDWIIRRPLIMIPLRLIQSVALPLWPLSWQYQVYHLCSLSPSVDPTIKNDRSSN